MDKSTRNHIQRATQAGRTLLERTFSEQLEGTFDILLDGTIAEQAGDHLSDSQKVIREKLVATVAHKRSTGLSDQAAVQAYLREAAFTALNRFVALKMLEARDLVQECVSKGEDSSGFKEFTMLAPGLVAVGDKGYRLYIETIFDEIGQEVKVLFDRRDVASLLWPDRQTLLELLGILNAPELAPVWAEDETIGWVYQYFNGDEERTKMRKESQAPRNSRELAVRNQFFTPRYVVEFLTDNTLGRTWYEMMQGETKLAHLDYLVRRPNEVFLAEGASAPESEMDDRELSQEELLQQTVYVLFRTKKDPRDLRILDPACGSGHFLLYAFKLLIWIYEEAWNDTGAVAFTETGTTLRDDFCSLAELRRAMPELILRHNLHGVDIDPRAAQIAALALWMRAQRAFNQFEFGRAERPAITKTNIVVAEPMPGDAELVEEFAASLKPPVLGDIFKKMVEEMKLAGELGSLLKIEESIAKAVKEADQATRQGNLFAGEMVGQNFWDTADEKIIAALGSFAESTAGGFGIRRQLFAGDAVQGVAFIELMRKRFDVVLMNPPFGSPVSGSKMRLRAMYPTTWKDLYAGFIDRSFSRLTVRGRVGAITSSTYFNLSTFSGLRGFILEQTSSALLVDLGTGVMDDAAVSAAACVLEHHGAEEDSQPFVFIDARFAQDKATSVRAGVASLAKGALLSEVTPVSPGDLARLPDQILAYWLTPRMRKLFVQLPSLGTFGVATFGLHARGGDEQFYRAWWELHPDELRSKQWPAVRLGGKPQHYFRNNYYVVDWRGDARSLREVAERASGGTFTGRKLYFKPGLSYIYTAQTTFSVQPIEAGSVFTAAAHGLFPQKDDDRLVWLGWLNSETVRLLTKVINPNRFFQASYVRKIPVPDLNQPELREFIVEQVSHAIEISRAHSTGDECSRLFGVDWATEAGWGTDGSPFSAACEKAKGRSKAIARIKGAVDSRILESYGLEPSDLRTLSDRIGASTALPLPGAVSLLKNGYQNSLESHLLAAMGIAFGRWDVAYWTREKDLAALPGPFDPLPWGQRASSEQDISRTSGVLLSDSGHVQDLESRLLQIIDTVWGKRANGIRQEIEDHLSEQSFSGDAIRDWLRVSAFSIHIGRNTFTKCKAPIYWQLATPSASYSVWCYYHRLTSDTFFRVANDYVTPKADHEERKLNTLRQEAGPDPSSKQRKAIDAQETFVAELRAFQTEVTRIAPLWNPNLNDGVIINFAPLWRLVPQHKPWQKECKKVWDTLVKGDYDWAHLAMHLWPERVVPKCKDDRSLAIAHGLEDDFWYEDNGGKWQNRKVSGDQIEQLVAEHSSTAVRAALKDLLEAPAPAGQTRRKRRAKA